MDTRAPISIAEWKGFQREVERLTAENARLRGEVEEEQRLREVWRSSSFNNEAIAMEGLARIAALTADLARVTGERDDLKEWKVLHAELSGDLLARVTAERDGLRERIDAVMAGERELLVAYETWGEDPMDSAMERVIDAFLADHAARQPPGEPAAIIQCPACGESFVREGDEGKLLPAALEAVLRDPDVRLVGEDEAARKAIDFVIRQSHEAAALVYPDDVPKATVSATPPAPAKERP